MGKKLHFISTVCASSYFSLSPLPLLLSFFLLTLTLSSMAPIFEIKVKTCTFEAAYVYVYAFLKTTISYVPQDLLLRLACAPL